jgi:hypothetical protein
MADSVVAMPRPDRPAIDINRPGLPAAHPPSLTATSVKKWTCPSCSRTRTAPYCAQCGEEPLRPRDLTSRDVLAQIAKVFSSLDSNMSRSFRLLLTRPGALTLAHVRGQRRQYLRPLQCFLVANAMFFAMQSLTHTAIFASPLASHLAHQDWSEFARAMVSPRLAARHITLDAYARLFDPAVAFYAKTLIILMALAFAPMAALLFRGQRLPIGAHLVFALHFYVFEMTLFSVSLVIAAGDVLLGGGGLNSGPLDAILTLVNLVAGAAYLWLACGRAYRVTGLPRIAGATVLAIWAAALVPGYRFALFLIGFLTT